MKNRSLKISKVERLVFMWTSKSFRMMMRLSTGRMTESQDLNSSVNKVYK